MLGEFQIWRNHLSIRANEWKSHKEKTLLKILLVHRDHVILQDQLIELLWPDVRYSAALNNLWVTISNLRRLLEPALRKPSDSQMILSQPSGYKLTTSGTVRLDIDDFSAQVAAGNELCERGQFHAALIAYRAAQALYTGDFLAEDRYEEWTLTKRLELSQEHLHLLKTMAECHMTLEQYQQALSPLLKILTLQPCWETIWRKVMLCHWLSGERDQALFAFDRCREILKKQLKVPPMSSTLELRDRILRGELASPQYSLK
jgi:DNA-binding SARP family transcriptional activator